MPRIRRNFTGAQLCAHEELAGTCSKSRIPSILSHSKTSKFSIQRKPERDLRLSNFMKICGITWFPEKRGIQRSSRFTCKIGCWSPLDWLTNHSLPSQGIKFIRSSFRLKKEGPQERRSPSGSDLLSEWVLFSFSNHWCLLNSWSFLNKLWYVISSLYSCQLQYMKIYMTL